MNRLFLLLSIALALASVANAQQSLNDGGARDLVSDWMQRDTLKQMQEVMGRFSPHRGKKDASAFEIRIEEETDLGSFFRRRISYQSEPGNRVPAYLLIPRAALAVGAKPVPAVLCLHPTNIELGANVAVGLGGAANRAYALELAQRGFVTLAPCYPTMGGYEPDLEKLGYQSGTMKAIVDNVRGIDMLETLPFVKRGSVGAIGHSLGGHNALFTAAFEPRITVVVTSCGFDSFRDYYSDDAKMWETGKGWTQSRYMPRLADYAGRLDKIPFDFDEILALLAPRVVFINAPLGDTNFQWRSVDRMIAAARPIFQKHNVEKHLEVVHPDCGHDFPDEIRERAYQLFEKHLK